MSQFIRCIQDISVDVLGYEALGIVVFNYVRHNNTWLNLYGRDDDLNKNHLVYISGNSTFPVDVFHSFMKGHDTVELSIILKDFHFVLEKKVVEEKLFTFPQLVNTQEDAEGVVDLLQPVVDISYHMKSGEFFYNISTFYDQRFFEVPDITQMNLFFDASERRRNYLYTFIASNRLNLSNPNLQIILYSKNSYSVNDAINKLMLSFFDYEIYYFTEERSGDNRRLSDIVKLTPSSIFTVHSEKQLELVKFLPLNVDHVNIEQVASYCVNIKQIVPKEPELFQARYRNIIPNNRFGKPERKVKKLRFVFRTKLFNVVVVTVIGSDDYLAKIIVDKEYVAKIFRNRKLFGAYYSIMANLTTKI